MRFAKHVLAPVLALASLLCAAFPAVAQTLTGLSPPTGAVNPNEDFNLSVQMTPPAGQQVWCGLRVEYGDGNGQDVRVGSEGFQSLPLRLSHRYATPGMYTVRIVGRGLARGLRSAAPCEGPELSAQIRVADPAAEAAVRRAEAAAERERVERARLQMQAEQIAREKREQAEQLARERQEQAEQLARERRELEAQRREAQERERLAKERESLERERERLAKERELLERERQLKEREAALARKTQETAKKVEPPAKKNDAKPVPSGF